MLWEYMKPVLRNGSQVRPHLEASRKEEVTFMKHLEDLYRERIEGYPKKKEK